MLRSVLRGAKALGALALLAVTLSAHADVATESPEVVEARALFSQGARLVAEGQWAEALASFERSAEKRPHATTSLNIGACERALGRYTRAIGHFEHALERGRSYPNELSESLKGDVRAYSEEINRL